MSVPWKRWWKRAQTAVRSTESTRWPRQRGCKARVPTTPPALRHRGSPAQRLEEGGMALHTTDHGRSLLSLFLTVKSSTALTRGLTDRHTRGRSVPDEDRGAATTLLCDS